MTPASRRARRSTASDRAANCFRGIAVLALLAFALAGQAHPGRLDDAGCHTEKASGRYHCHTADRPTRGGKTVAATELRGRVVSVTDGDTIRLLTGDNKTLTIRLKGIDAPEHGQPFGQASRKYLASLIADRPVLVRTEKRDQYGRVLGDIWVAPADCARCDETLHVNHAMVQAGMAWWYRRYANEQSAGQRKRYASAEQDAKAARRGLWADPQPVAPWEWRRR